MDKKYRIVFLGLTCSEKEFKFGMSSFGVSQEQSLLMLQKAPVILKDNVPLSYARKYADAVQQAGGNVSIRENSFFKNGTNLKPLNIEPLDSFIMCPECGHKQYKKSFCEKCGFEYE